MGWAEVADSGIHAGFSQNFRMANFIHVRAAADIGRPVLLRVAVKTNGASQGAAAHAAPNAKGQREGPLAAVLLRENKGSAGGLFQERSQ